MSDLLGKIGCFQIFWYLILSESSETLGKVYLPAYEPAYPEESSSSTGKGTDIMF